MKERRGGTAYGVDSGAIRDVLEATATHLKALRAMRRKGRIDGLLDDVIEGMAISADKLRLLLAGLKAAKPSAGRKARVVVSVAGGVVTGVMSGVPGLRAEVFDFDDRVSELADGEFRDEPNSGKAADKADREFHDATNGMADALAAAAGKEGKS
jgi:hypothetical protein